MGPTRPVERRTPTSPTSSIDRRTGHAGTSAVRGPRHCPPRRPTSKNDTGRIGSSEAAPELHGYRPAGVSLENRPHRHTEFPRYRGKRRSYSQNTSFWSATTTSVSPRSWKRPTSSWAQTASYGDLRSTSTISSAGRYRFPPEESPPDASEHEDRAGAPEIAIEAVLTGLSDEQASHFADYIEWWDQHESDFYVEEDLLGLDEKPTTPALRVSFRGRYIEDEDDFEGTTFFTRSLEEEDRPRSFTRRDKQLCGFLFLRGRRTGSRALSLGRGSLLDIILRQRELRPRMWEQTINQLADVDVAEDPELGISGILQTLEESLKKYVPQEWGVAPHLRVSDLTRGHLRDVITAFLASGTDTHAVPFHRQGAGTINVLVLALLSQIAEDKQNAIFAMEEPRNRDSTLCPEANRTRASEHLGSVDLDLSLTLRTGGVPYDRNARTQAKLSRSP